MSVGLLTRLLSGKSRVGDYRIPRGERVYAVGDVHGRLDLLLDLVRQIEVDNDARGEAGTTIVFLGDLIDRGPDSAGVIDAVLDLSRRRSVRVLCGNHEEMFLGALESDDVLRQFLRFGGRETVLSYGVDESQYAELELGELRGRLPVLVPAEHLEFLRNLEDWVRIGDYLFVHAGIRPGVPLALQSKSDLRWIREPFLGSAVAGSECVVHGHSVFDAPRERAGRIGIDTGAYQSGRLTALGLEGGARWYMST